MHRVTAHRYQNAPTSRIKYQSTSLSLDTEGKTMNTQDRSMIAISSSHGIMHAYLVLLPAMIPILGGELGDIATVGMLASLVTLFYGWFSFPIGFIADRYSKKMLITISMILCGGASLIIGFSPSIPIAAIGLITLGIGASLYHPCGYAHMSLLSDESRGRYMGIQGLSGDMGMAVSYLTSSLLGIRYGWRMTFIIWGITRACHGGNRPFCGRRHRHKNPERNTCGTISHVEEDVRNSGQRHTHHYTGNRSTQRHALDRGSQLHHGLHRGTERTISFVIAGGLSTLKYTVGAFAQILGGELSDRDG